ncbi:ArsR/SmtB family transcription factor [Methanoregula formicica]|uniref:Putative transcriptional regulator n=1 Tax=Methanoregula formicica (strain DSM 22288 / NBRC 105244 / SMSP) TaxID=593750 RepID=L0HFY4_METFS|nr:metalloregulator ArsR/SmtB family transcription factor [Methanoregula formicica]AGB02004.1 putative transcriptional regulator [Methanoregula formicica SMSP]
MRRVTHSCCKKTAGCKPEGKVPDIPEQIQQELDRLGGLDALLERMPPEDELEETSRVYHALSDPLRLSVLYLIRDQPLCVCIINRFTRLSGSKLSYHLNILKESGLIEGEYHGNWIIYSLTEKGQQFVAEPK